MSKIMRKIRWVVLLILVLILVLFFIVFMLDFYRPYFFSTIPTATVPAGILEDPETEIYHAFGGRLRDGARRQNITSRDKEPFYLGRTVVNFKKEYVEFEAVTPAPGEEMPTHFKLYLIGARNLIHILKGEPMKSYKRPADLFYPAPDEEPPAFPPPPTLFSNPDLIWHIGRFGIIPPDVGEVYFKNGWVKEREPDEIRRIPLEMNEISIPDFENDAAFGDFRFRMFKDEVGNMKSLCSGALEDGLFKEKELFGENALWAENFCLRILEEVELVEKELKKLKEKKTAPAPAAE